MTHTKNAIIKSASITTEDYGCLTVWITLDYGGSGQGFGGFHLGNGTDPKKNMVAGKGNVAGAFIVGCLRAAGVMSWDRLVGKAIRVRLDSDNLNAKISAIGHITDNGSWFNPSEVFGQ